MTRLLIAITLAAGTFGVVASDTEAAGGPFHKWRAYGRPAASVRPKATQGELRRAFPTYSRYQSVEDAYPKYIGAFNARYFNDLAIPTGDIGIRGNTVHMLPW